MKTGKNPAFFHPNAPKMANLILPNKLPPPPATVDYSSRVQNWPMFDNDTLGDCTVAGIGHLIQLFSSYTKPSPMVMTEQEIIQTYSAVGGYVPGDQSTDNGAVESNVLDYWMNNGVSVQGINNKITGFAKINVQNKEELQYAMYWFGGVYLGVQLPLVWQNTETTWAMPPNLEGNNAPGSWGGHCVCAVAVNPQGITVISWGEKINLSWDAYTTYVDEAWAIIDPVWVNQQGKCPANNFDWSQLLSDMQLVKENKIN